MILETRSHKEKKQEVENFLFFLYLQKINNSVNLIEFAYIG